MSIEVTEEIKEYLISKDKQLKVLFDRYGLLAFSSNETVFNSIVYHIVEQMLSIKAARKIYDRLSCICNNDVNPKTISALSVEDIRKCGISTAKAAYISKFSSDYLNGTYDFSTLSKLPDEEVVSYLTQIKGVGKWTAEMIALFVLGKKNIFSFGDVALKNGIMKFMGFRTISKKRFEALRKKYSPYCSYISLYFYKCNDDKSFYRNQTRA